jgi:integrase
VICARRVEELTTKKHTAQRQDVGIEKKERKPRATLGKFGQLHLEMKAKSQKFSSAWLAQCEMHLREATRFFGSDRELVRIKPEHVEEYLDHLRGLSNGRGGTLSPGSLRKYLNTLGNLYRRAGRRGKVPRGYNPIKEIEEKPADRKHEARWLEVHDAALYLEAARVHKSDRAEVAMPYMHAVVATFLLTGGRESEVMGLEVSDINFDRATVTFRPNQWRRLKNDGSQRVVKLWPQLAPILREHLKTEKIAGGLLFPSVRPDGEKPRMVTDVRKQLDAIGGRVGFKTGEIRTTILRHTYCSARLQTLDGGAPVSVFTVGRELGHGGDSLVKKVYGHLGEVRHRAEVVEYVATKAIKAIPDLKVRKDYQDRLKALAG